MLVATLYAVPAPGQCIKGEDCFLGTVRTHMHKAPFTALIAGIHERLDQLDTRATVRIVDMQTLDRDREDYGELAYESLTLEKFRVGATFSRVTDLIKEDDIVGINANFTHSRLIAGHFAQYAKRVNPKALIVCGGTDATQDPEYYLRAGADVVVKGEAEQTFATLIAALDHRKPLDEVPNLAFVRHGTVVHTPRVFLRDYFDVENMPPPDLGAVDLMTYTDTGEGKPPTGVQPPFISIETSRGCAQACTFCATPSTKGRYRFMRYDRVKQHFEYFRAMGVTTLLFQEDNVLSRIHRAADGRYAYPDGRDELLAMFRLARDMGFTWEFTNGIEFGQYIHDGRVDHELIETMFWHSSDDNGMRGGCYRATIPLENLSDDGSKLFRKLKPLGESARVIRALAETGINTLTFNLIVGRPQDDDEIVRLSHDRCRHVRDVVGSASPSTTVYFNVYNLSLFPGTVDYKKLKHLLAFDIELHPEVITFYLGCLRTAHYSPLEITQVRGTLASSLNGADLIGNFDETRFITHPRFERILSGRSPLPRSDDGDESASSAAEVTIAPPADPRRLRVIS